MKKNVFSLMLLSFLMISLFSCSDDEEESFDAKVGMIGEWKVNSSDTKIGGVSLDDLGDDSFEIDFGAFIKGAQLDFQDDGTLMITEDGDERTGSWTAEQKTVTIDDYEIETVYTVTSLSSSQAVLYQVDENFMETGQKFEVTTTLTK